MINERKPHILIVFFICVVQFVYCQIPYSTQQVAAGYAASYIQDNVANVTNPSSLIGLTDDWNANASYENRHFSDINSSHLTLSRSWQKEGLALSFFNYGLPEFRTNQWSLSYARLLSPSWSIGAQFSYDKLIIQNNGTSSGVNLSLNIHHHASDYIDLHLLARNLNSQSDIGLQEYVAGALIKVRDELKLNTEYSYLPHLKEGAFIVGIHYEPIDKIQISIAINTLYQGPTLGLQYDNDTYIIAAAVSNHHQLGRSASLTIGGRF